MRSFRKFFQPIRWIGLCVGTAIVIVLSAMEAKTMVPLSTPLSTPFTKTSKASKAIQTPAETHLPEWLQMLNLDEAQIRHVFEIDTLLEQRLQIILTSDQYSQWQSSQINLSDATGNETWNFEDIDIDLSPYQQTAVDAAFRESLQSLLAMLSTEQQQQLLRYLSEGNTTPSLGVGI